MKKVNQNNIKMNVMDKNIKKIGKNKKFKGIPTFIDFNHFIILIYLHLIH